MKVYNVKDVNRFFEKLTECSGDVEMVNAEGEHISLMDDSHKNLNDLVATYVMGTIKEMDLRFEDSKDAFAIMEYLMAS